jgi:hydroxypyruvate isomerase
MIGHDSLPEGLNQYDNHDRIEEELRESIDIAAEHEIPGVICFSGNRNDGQSDYEGMIACARGLRRIAPYAEEMGVNLNVELLNSKVNHPGYQCDHTDWGLALCEMVDSPRVKLLYDIYHMQIMEGDIIRNIQKSIDRIGHFHTAGNPGRNDMDNTQEMNYVGICSAIAETPYDLYVGHEFSPKGDPVEALKETFAICNQG